MLVYVARENHSIPIANISIPGVPKGSYTVLIFDGEQNGFLSTRAAAVQNVVVTEGGPEPARGIMFATYVTKFVDCEPE